MNHSDVINSVAGELNSAERDIDQAIAQATQLVQSMIAGRAELSLSPVAFAASQSKAMDAIAALSAARDAMVACHGEMAKDHRRMGWGVFAVGPLNKPSDDTKPQAAAHLVRVA